MPARPGGKDWILDERSFSPRHPRHPAEAEAFGFDELRRQAQDDADGLRRTIFTPPAGWRAQPESPLPNDPDELAAEWLGLYARFLAAGTSPAIIAEMTGLLAGIVPAWGRMRALSERPAQEFESPDAALALMTLAGTTYWEHVPHDTCDEALAAVKWLRATRAVTKEQPPPPDDRRHSADFTSVLWFGDKFLFTKNQAACVKLLWNAMENETAERDGLSIVVEAELSQTRLLDVFRTKGGMHPAWKTLIVPGGPKGSYRLVDGPAKKIT